jgi:hypothetical protein
VLGLAGNAVRDSRSGRTCNPGPCSPGDLPHGKASDPPSESDAPAASAGTPSVPTRAAVTQAACIGPRRRCPASPQRHQHGEPGLVCDRPRPAGISPMRHADSVTCIISSSRPGAGCHRQPVLYIPFDREDGTTRRRLNSSSSFPSGPEASRTRTPRPLSSAVSLIGPHSLQRSRKHLHAVSGIRRQSAE